ncbi:fibronectin type III domain-containing protein [Paenibacillus terrigena]|uniref:fibronectin type III domain-containing protein n=1 Tax=Paenibacillus terrigena TaxID=369333 RepID=UPI0028D63527|nr:fibronectin type III domain-containing protein [Paenibacillus terrigena]
METDSTPPIISNVFPGNGSTITENSTTLSAGVADTDSGLNLSSIEFKLDGEVLGTGSIPVNYMHGLAFTYSPELQNGTHTFEIQVTDQAGNVAQYTSVFYVKQSIWPEGSTLVAGNNNLYSVTLSWTAAEGSKGYRIYSGQQHLAELDETIRSYEVTELQAGSYYGFKVEAQLPDGSWSTDGPFVFTETLPLPHFPPTVWAVYPSTGTTVTTANPIITAKIRDAGFGLQKDAILVKVDDELVPFSYDEKTWNLTAEATGLENGYHSLRIRALDNEGVYKDYYGTFIVQAVWPAESTLSAENVGQTSLSLSWTPAAGSSGYRIFRNGEIIDTVSDTILSYEASDLQPSTSYTFKIEAKQTDGVWTTDGPTVSATTGMLSNRFLERLIKLHAALAAGDPSDVQDVRNLRDEIAGLNDADDLSLIDPVWNKISAKLPQDVDQTELKSSLFQLIKAIGSIHYNSYEAELYDIQTNSAFRETLNTIAAAGGQNSLTIVDFMTFLSGDGDSLIGLEGTIASLLAQKSKPELVQLVLDKQKQTKLLLDALEQLLGDSEAYRVTSIFNQLGVTPQDLLAVAQTILQKLQEDKPAINALAVAYIRSEAVETVKITANGKKHNYSLKVLDINLPSALFKWSKVSGDDKVTVLSNGTVSIPNQLTSGTVVIQASLFNPYGGNAKVIFQKEVTLVNGGGNFNS